MITIPVSEFRRLVTLATPFAGKDPILPVFMTIRFDTRNGYLTAAATDRYRMIIARTRCGGDFHALIPVEACKRIATTFKPDRRTQPDISLTERAGQVEVSLTGTVSGISDADLTVAQYEGEWPKIEMVFQKVLDAEPARTALNTTLLHDVPKTTMGEGAVFIPAGNGKPALIVSRDWIVAQQALGHVEDPLESWRSLLAVDAEAEAA